MMIVAMFGFAGLVFADSGNPAKKVGPGGRIAKPLAISEQDAASPSGDNTPPLANSAFVAPPANDTCAGATPLPLNITVKGTTVGANNDYQSPATAACYPGTGQTPTNAPGRDVVYSFSAPADGKYSFRIIQQHPSDVIRTQNTVLYLTDCANAGTVNCLAGANRPMSAAFVSSTGASNNQSEEISCYPMTSGQTVYLVFDDGAPGKCTSNLHPCFGDSDCAPGATCTPTLNDGGAMSVEVINCYGEVEPNNTSATATPYICGAQGEGSAGANALCFLGPRAGQACTRSGFLEQTLPNSNMRCSLSGAQCVVDTATGLGNCPAGDGICQQLTDLDCDPRCDIGPNAGKSCTTQAFCNPVSDQGATCAGTCQALSTCIVTATNVDTGVACVPVCVGSSIPSVNGRYCSSLSGCPGGGTCTTNAQCPSGQSCSRVYNEGDIDFWALGTVPAGSKVFAGVDAKSANDYDWRMRITTDSQTLQFDDDDVTSRGGANAPVIAGAVADGTNTYIKVSRTAARAAATYDLYAHVRPAIGAAQLEDESGPTGNDIYFGWPGDVINANYVTAGGYVKGTFGFRGDSDCFKFLVNKGDLMDWFGDANPTRAAGAVSTVDIPQPIIYDAEPAGISNFIFGANPRKNTTPNVNQPTQNALSPAVTSSYFQWRASYTGMLEVCYYGSSAPLSQGTPAYPNNWAGSMTVNCGPLQAAGPGTTTADVSVVKTGPASPVTTGSIIDYTITVTNTGTEIAQEVKLFETLDANLTFLALSVDDTLGGNNTACFSLPTAGANDAPIDCNNASMAPGSTTVYTVTVQVNNCLGDGIVIDNTATITTVSTDPNPANDSSTATLTTAAAANNGCVDLNCAGGSCVIDLCTTNDHCEAGVCVTEVTVCNDNSLCTDDSCISATGCFFDSSNAGDMCDDFNPCTQNACDPVLFCVFPAEPTSTLCDDGLACTSADHCDGAGSCGGLSVCDDANGCTDDFADELNACACSHAPSVSGTPCSDNNACTGTVVAGDACNGAGLCLSGQAVVCDDGNPCTTDSCDVALGCVYTAVVCVASDQCHVAGTCDPGTGLCDNPSAADGTTCNDGDTGTDPDTCQAGICVGTSLCNVQPKPKSSGYYKKLCKKGVPNPSHTDALTDADAACVGQLTATFAGITTAADICDVYDHDSNGGHDTNGPNNKECQKGEDELMGLALNICRQRICLDQVVDSACGSGHDSHNRVPTTVAASLATTDDILSDPARTKTSCKDGKCLAKEINNGKGIHQVSLTIAKASGNGTRLSWESPIMDDGSGDGTKYTIWRRELNSDLPYAKILDTTAFTWVDNNAGTGNWEYEVTFTVQP